MRLKKTLLLGFLLVLTWCVRVYHIGVLPPLPVSDSAATGRWIDKSVYGIHQLILQGDAYGRGLKAGELTKSLLQLQENELTARLFEFLPETAVKLLEIPLIRYFWGIEKFVDPWMFEEMYGVSKSAPKEFDRLIDSFTRQLAYHGLHEVGQMMVDQGGDDAGCTVVAVPSGSSWVLGRNFDFEGGRTLDREKIVKWVFPDNGYAFVSVIWAGMVGGVTAVNENGIYLSLNAAGSSDHRRFGMPTSLLLIKTLMSARTADEALLILKSEPTFITDIFVLLDSRSGRLYRIEKSPLKTEVIRLQEPSVVTNHLISPAFENDKSNLFRKEQLTTLARSRRGEALLKNPIFAGATKSTDLELPVLKILRDKGDGPLFLGNRKAIDSLIATHSVIFNSENQTLFVSQGPALAGPFVGFDLKSSFRKREPVVTKALPRDDISDETFDEIHESARAGDAARSAVAKNECVIAKTSFEKIRFRESSGYFEAAGDLSDRCDHSREKAVENWRKALTLQPAYLRDERRLGAKLKMNGAKP